LIPINPPVMAFNDAMNNIKYVKELVNIKFIIIKGASFCHVERMNAEIHEIEVITDGYHM
jgi:hypothetical protein